MHCAHCGEGECVRTSSNPTVLRCNNCGTYWTDATDLAARLTALEDTHAKALARMARMWIEPDGLEHPIRRFERITDPEKSIVPI